jgi:hypothetical protein
MTPKSNPLPLPNVGEVWGIPDRPMTWRLVTAIYVDVHFRIFGDSASTGKHDWQSWAADKQRIIS